MSTAAWLTVGTVVWLAVAIVTGVLIGRMIRGRDQQRPPRPVTATVMAVLIWVADHAPHVIAVGALIAVTALLVEAHHSRRGRHHQTSATRRRVRVQLRQRKGPRRYQAGKALTTPGTTTPPPEGPSR